MAISGNLNPHGTNSLALFRTGLKPLAMLHAIDPDCAVFDALVAEGCAACGSFHQLIPSRSQGIAGTVIMETRLYAQPDQAWRIAAMTRVYAERSERGLSEFEHAVIGWLLGYGDDDVQVFLDHIEAESNARSTRPSMYPRFLPQPGYECFAAA